MVRIADTIRSKWLKADDIPGGPKVGSWDLTIRRVSLSRFSDGRDSLDLEFHETPKVLGCNVTNRKALQLIFGEDVETDDLVGQRIRLVAVATQDSNGRPCWGVRIQTPPGDFRSASTAARERIGQAMQRTGARPRQAPPAGPRGATSVVRPRLLNDPPAAADQGPYEPPDERFAPPGPEDYPDDSSPLEPTGFVDDQDPGFDDRWEGRNR